MERTIRPRGVHRITHSHTLRETRAEHKSQPKAKGWQLPCRVHRPNRAGEPVQQGIRGRVLMRPVLRVDAGTVEGMCAVD